MLCDAIELPCALIIGTTTNGRHQWNIVKIDNINYLIDTTTKSGCWAREGSILLNGYTVDDNFDEKSLGHAGLSMTMNC